MHFIRPTKKSLFNFKNVTIMTSIDQSPFSLLTSENFSEAKVNVRSPRKTFKYGEGGPNTPF